MACSAPVTVPAPRPHPDPLSLLLRGGQESGTPTGPPWDLLHPKISQPPRSTLLLAPLEEGLSGLEPQSGPQALRLSVHLSVSSGQCHAGGSRG